MSLETPESALPAQRCPRCGTEYEGGDSCPKCGLLQAAVPCDDDPSVQARFRCVICGRAVCGPEPEGEQPALCDIHDTVPVIEGWAQVYTTTDEIEAGLIVHNLRAEEIDAQPYSQKDAVFPVDLGELSIVRVLVPAWQFEQAIEVIRGYMDASGEVGFACPNCGEVYEPGQETCANCGAALPAAPGGPRADDVAP